MISDKWLFRHRLTQFFALFSVKICKICHLAPACAVVRGTNGVAKMALSEL